jgi:hypothetical protein
MQEKHDGDSAFPRAGNEWSQMEWVEAPAQQGMTLRDYFAGQALASINLGIGVTDDFYSRTAKHCYALADAMLKAREE